MQYFLPCLLDADEWLAWLGLLNRIERNGRSGQDRTGQGESTTMGVQGIEFNWGIILNFYVLNRDNWRCFSAFAKLVPSQAQAHAGNLNCKFN